MFTAVAFLELYLIIQNIFNLRKIPVADWNNWQWITAVITVLLILFFIPTLYFSFKEIKEKLQKGKEVTKSAKNVAAKLQQEQLEEDKAAKEREAQREEFDDDTFEDLDDYDTLIQNLIKDDLEDTK